MSPPGVRRHRRRDSEDGDLDRRHPFENVPRFRSPSRPQRSADVDDFRRLGLAVATSCMIQSVLWAGMTTAAILVYRDIVPVPEIPPPDTGSWEDFETILTYSYFKEGAILPAAAMPEQGLVTPLTMYRMMSSAFLISVFWFICSAVLFAKLRSGGPRSWVLSIRVWAFSTSVVTIMDVVLGSAMIRDLVVLSEKESSAGADKALVSKLSHCAAVVLVVALRAGLLLFANVGLMIALLYLLSNRLNPPTRLASAPPGGESPSATKREGPIDAFLFSSSSFRSNDGQSGIRNPAFVPDDRIAPAGGPPHSLTNWTSFKPPPEGPRQPQPQPGPDGPRSSNPKRLRRITSKELEDMAHLSWMEEPQRHVDVELRRPLGWPGPGPGTPPPADARHAVFEPEVPELPDGHTGRGPDFGFSYLHGPGHILPRARINPEAAAAAARPPPGPGAPNIPPPDYSPRAPGRRAREQAGWATVQRGARSGPRLPPTAAPAPPRAPAALCADNAPVTLAEGDGEVAGNPALSAGREIPKQITGTANSGTEDYMEQVAATNKALATLEFPEPPVGEAEDTVGASAVEVAAARDIVEEVLGNTRPDFVIQFREYRPGEEDA